MEAPPKHPDVAAQFACLLRELGISGNQLATALGTSQQAISNYTSGRNKPGREILAAIAKRYPAINSNWLLTGEGEPFPNGRFNEKSGGETNNSPEGEPASDEPEMVAETNSNPWFHRYHALLDLMKATGGITSSQHGALKKSKGSAPAAVQQVEENRIFVTGYRRYEPVMFINRDATPNRLAWVDAILEELCATPAKIEAISTFNGTLLHA